LSFHTANYLFFDECIRGLIDFLEQLQAAREASSCELQASSAFMQSFFTDVHSVFYFGQRSANEQFDLLSFFSFSQLACHFLCLEAKKVTKESSMPP
jgi:hypothetical protein